MKATISADIIQSTTLPVEELFRLREELECFITSMRKFSPGSWGRIVRGDGVECAISDEHDLLHIVLMLICHVKSLGHRASIANAKGVGKRFLRMGVRMALSVGELRVNSREKGILDGPAIYESGRALEKMGKIKVLEFSSENKNTEGIARALFILCHQLIVHATARQCQVFLLHLQGETKAGIAKILNITEIAVYQHLQAMGADALDEAMACYEAL